MTIRLAAIRDVAADPRAELLVAGRTSAATLAWLERHTAGRVRAWVEERGLRAASRLAIGATTTRAANVRAPTSVLGIVLDEAGPGALGDLLARMCDAAIVDTRVLLAHRLGTDEAAWPLRRGSLRLGPPAVRAGGRSVAPGADRVRGGGADPDPAGRAHAGRPGGAAGRRRAPRAGSVVDVTPGLRRDPAPDLDAVGEDEALVARIREEIERDGPITFARFMDLALYDPDGGYYRAEPRVPVAMVTS